jgi:hypothetical protein
LGNHNLTYLFGALHCSPYLENLAMLSRWHPLKLFIWNTKSKVWFHLTRAESQAAMMVGVPQGLT